MKSSLKKALVLLSVVISFTVGCSTTAKTQLEYSNSNCRTVVDYSTGVNYIIYDNTGRAGMCPRYNADGTLYVTEQTPSE